MSLRRILEPSSTPQPLKMEALCYFKISGKINPVAMSHSRRPESATYVNRAFSKQLKLLQINVWQKHKLWRILIMWNVTQHDLVFKVSRSVKKPSR
jgi:hypothetical protein